MSQTFWTVPVLHLWHRQNICQTICPKFGFGKFLSSHKCFPSQDKTLSNESS